MIREQHMEYVEILVDHEFALEDRRKDRTEELWPDESDIFTATIGKLKLSAFQDLLVAVRNYRYEEGEFTGAKGEILEHALAAFD